MRVAIRSLGELCITAGLVLLLFVAYELWGTGAYTREQQQSLREQLDKSWKAAAPVTRERVRLGQGIAMIRIPRLGNGYRYVVIEGVSVSDLRKGPGHYPGTAMPGEVGNFVLSAHRTTYNAPFSKVNQLRPGDKILVDTRDKQFVYQMTDRKVVSPSAVTVAAPVPLHPKKDPTQRLITLTTCHPRYSAKQRLVIFGELTQELPRVKAGAS